MTYQEITWNFLRSKGLTEKSTSAVMGNIQAESGFNPDVIESSTGIGFGLCQWSYGRRSQLESYGTDINHQLEFLWSELTGQNLSVTGADYQWINKSGYLSHDDFMNGMGSVDDLTSAFCFCWERPNESLAHLEVRQQSANAFYVQFTGTAPVDPNKKYCKLIYPYWFCSNIKISYIVNKFEIVKQHGNVILIKSISNNRHYYVNKSYIKYI